jgi:hypothetical protein
VSGRVTAEEGAALVSAGEGGFVVVELVAGLAVLVLPVALLVLALPVWGERQDAARVAAREIGRVVARDGRCRPAVARRLGITVATNLGVRSRDVTVVLDCVPGTELAPGSRVTATVTVTEPGLRIPAIGRIGGWSFTVRHAEPVDRYAGAP